MWTGDFGGSEQATAATLANNTVSTHDYGLLVRDFTAGGAAPTVTASTNTFNSNDIQALSTGESIFDIFASLAGNSFDRAVTVEHGSLLPAIWSSIQDGVDAAVAGDTVHVAEGTYSYTSTTVINKALTLAGPVGGGALLQGTAPDTISALEISASNVTVQNLEFTHIALPAFASPFNEALSALVRVINGTGLSGITLAGNEIYVPAQAGAMSTWNGVAITVNDNVGTGITITGNTVYNTRNGIVVRTNNSANVSNNTVYNTKGGVMLYTSNQADADNRTVSNNAWGTAHNEWDIVWNTAYYVPDYQQILTLSAANNDAYVLDRRAADAAACAALIGNRSHIFVDAASTVITAHPAKGNFNEPFATLALGIEAVVPGGTVYVADGTYTGNANINKALTLLGPNAGIDPNTGARVAEAVIQGEVTVTANNVSLDGFTVTNPAGKHGLTATDRSNLTITNNIFDDIGSADTTTSGTNYGIAIISTAAAVDDVAITHNLITNIAGGDFKSANGIAFGWSTGIYDITNVLIQNNVISDVTSSIQAYASGGRGAYGIILNHARGNTGNTGRTVAPQIRDNDISDLEGLWAHGIGLEGNTPDALVQGNTIDNLVDHKSPADPDAAAIMVEDNLSANTVDIHLNSFTNTLLGVRNQTALAVDAERNWWGDTNPSDNVYNPAGGSVDYSPLCGDEVCSFFVEAPAAFNKANPGNGSLGRPSTVNLYWYYSSGATSYEYCYDTTNDGACSNWVSTGLTRNVTLSGLDADTTYYWQVRAMNNFGSTYANGSETAYWSFRTGSLPGGFNKSSPANGATIQSSSPTLSWGASSAATSYEYCYDTTDDGTCSTWVSTGTDRSVTLSGLEANTVYYWQVRANNGFGSTYANGSQTAFWSFTTGIQPAAFNKVNPGNGSQGRPTTLTLYWYYSSGATSYEYCYDTTDDGVCSTWVSTGTTRYVTLSNLSPSTTYYWQVRAMNDFGSTYANGSETAYWSFRTGNLPGGFNKSSPANGATIQSSSPTLSWGASSAATSYEYCYDTTDDGTCSTWVSTGTDRSVTLSGLEANTTYYWQVRANNSVGSTYANGAQTAFWSFSGSLPAAFNKANPGNGSQGRPTTLTLYWYYSSGATSYEYCYDTTDDGACSTWVSTGTTRYVTLSGLDANTIYYWQVRAVNDFGSTYANGSETAYWWFRTRP